MKDYLYINGEIILHDTIDSLLDSKGMLFGWGLFETMRIYNNSIFLLEDHLERLYKACSLFDIPLTMTLEKIKIDLHRYITTANLKNCIIRLTVIKGSRNDSSILFFTSRELIYTQENYLNGFSTLVVKEKRNPQSLLTYYKTTDYLTNIYFRNKAIKKGYQECIFLNIYNKITEGSMTNIFFIKENVLYTPKISCGLLPGITRNFVIKKLASSLKIPVIEGNFTLPDMRAAQECFLTNSVLQIMPLIRVDNKAIGSGKPGRLTKELMQQYETYICTI